METQLAFDSKAKQLNLAFKERFVTDSNFQLKVTGNVNTQTGRSLGPLDVLSEVLLSSLMTKSCKLSCDQ